MNRIFAIAPAATGLFSFLKGVTGEDIYSDERLIKHASKVVETVSTAVQMVENEKLDDLIPILHKLGAAHVKYGVLPPHYDVVGQALIETLEAALSESFTDEIKSAWIEIYGVISSAMKEGAGYTEASD